MKLRKLAFNLHSIVGVILGLLLVVISLTGSLLVFDKEIDRVLHPNLFQVVTQGDRVPLETAIATARSAYPEAKPWYLELPDQTNATYKLLMKVGSDDWLNVYLNPYSGTLVGAQLRSRTFAGLLLNFHSHLLLGETGSIVVGIGGLMLLLLSITGAILWPGWSRFAQAFKIKWKGHPRRVNFDIHKVAGIFSVAFLVIIASTGAAMSFYTQFEGGIYWLTHTPLSAEPTSTLQAKRSPMLLDKILREASEALPNAKIIGISLPRNSSAAVKVLKKFPQQNELNAESKVYLDPYSGKILKVENSLEAPLATRIINALYPLHIGVHGGLGLRIVHVFVGFAPTVLVITGFAMWWHRLRIKVPHPKDPDRLDQYAFWSSEWPGY